MKKKTTRSPKEPGPQPTPPASDECLKMFGLPDALPGEDSSEPFMFSATVRESLRFVMGITGNTTHTFLHDLQRIIFSPLSSTVGGQRSEAVIEALEHSVARWKVSQLHDSSYESPAREIKAVETLQKHVTKLLTLLDTEKHPDATRISYALTGHVDIVRLRRLLTKVDITCNAALCELRTDNKANSKVGRRLSKSDIRLASHVLNILRTAGLECGQGGVFLHVLQIIMNFLGLRYSGEAARNWARRALEDASLDR